MALGGPLARLNTIRVRLTLWYVALLALILAAFSGAVYVTLAHALNQQMDDNLSLVGQQLLGQVNSQNGFLTFATSEGEGAAAGVEAVRARGFVVRLLDPNDQLLIGDPGSGPLPLPALGAADWLLARPQITILSRAGEPFRSYTIFFEENGRAVAAIQVAHSLQSVAATLSQLRWALVLSVPLTLLAASAGGFLFAARALAPVDQITRAAQHLNANDLRQRLNLKLPDDEVGRLARTFDDMLARLDDAFRREREFTADASHELRTPLTVMRGEIDVALQRPRRAAEYRRTLVVLGASVERMTRLSEDLLLLARSDERQFPINATMLSAAQVIKTVADEFRPLAETHQIKLEVRPAEDLSMWADESKTRRVLANLVENAVKFSEPGGRVVLSATQDIEAVAIVVADEGRGVPAADLPHLFDRFYRSQNARVAGAGLGLAIARALVLAQDGTLSIVSELGRGTICTVRLPSRQPPAIERV